MLTLANYHLAAVIVETRTSGTRLRGAISQILTLSVEPLPALLDDPSRVQKPWDTLNDQGPTFDKKVKEALRGAYNVAEDVQQRLCSAVDKAVKRVKADAGGDEKIKVRV